MTCKIINGCRIEDACALSQLISPEQMTEYQKQECQLANDNAFFYTYYYLALEGNPPRERLQCEYELGGRLRDEIDANRDKYPLVIDSMGIDYKGNYLGNHVGQVWEITGWEHLCSPDERRDD
jgi:hypothetical protein